MAADELNQLAEVGTTLAPAVVRFSQWSTHLKQDTYTKTAIIESNEL